MNSYTYTLDKVGNRLTKAEPDIKYTYGYDAGYRLLQSLPVKPQGQGKGKTGMNKEENIRPKSSAMIL